jgi:mRNA interferase MazF
MLGKLPGDHDDWLICMISSQMHQFVADFDEIIKDDDTDFQSSGLKVSSVVRVGRLAVVESSVLLGTTGEIEMERLQRIKDRLANWIKQL